MLSGHPYCKRKRNVGLVGEWVVCRQWEVGGSGDEDQMHRYGLVIRRVAGDDWVFRLVGLSLV